MEYFFLVLLFLNVLAFAAVVVLGLFFCKREEQLDEEQLKDGQLNEETEIPKSGKIILKKDDKTMFSLNYNGLDDFGVVHNAVFIQLLQRKKEGEDWIIEVIPS